MSENRARPKVSNPGKNVVRESLEGLVALNPGLRILENENCIFRHDFRQHVAAGKVSAAYASMSVKFTKASPQ